MWAILAKPSKVAAFLAIKESHETVQNKNKIFWITFYISVCYIRQRSTVIYVEVSFEPTLYIIYTSMKLNTFQENITCAQYGPFIYEYLLN